MRDAVLQTGIDPSKVFLIPIGINLDFFPLPTVEMRRDARRELGIPESAFVVGSFQKDGVGWGDGMEPKLIKGPDIFLAVLKEVKREIPELFVLLTGPSRGYVKRGLDEMGIPYKHAFLKSYPDVAKMYRASDLYLVASRQEGGPKAVLECMANLVPLVTTRVGQAMDLVKHGENAWMVEPEDVEGLAEGIRRVYDMAQADMQVILANGRATAEANRYESQDALWAEFMKGFVETR
ncbi:MAG: glycosyltransferase [Chloroflexi bacterium CFX2]|nr:glycosyltransferase [Chloroflexi bacterium CFX2]